MKRIRNYFHRIFHVHKWEYESKIDQTIRRCKCGTAHVNKHMVSQIYGGEHWYDLNDVESKH